VITKEQDPMQKEPRRQVARIDYDRAAVDYTARRRTHSGVFGELCQRAQLGPESCVLEVGCGTGNYIQALVDRWHCAAYGLDPSVGMLAQAADSSSCIGWVQGRAEELPFAPGAFDLIFSVDVIHHVSDRPAFFRQAVRLLRPGGQMCTVTDSADMIQRREILSGYFPETIDYELARYSRVGQLVSWMADVGLVGIEVATVSEFYQVSSTLPFRNKAYSSLHLISQTAWLAGLERLERDLAQGPVEGRSRYACVWAHTPGGGTHSVRGSAAASRANQMNGSLET
jgi:ubiquinone/menaquinone biosynthesis C-methylase UbiE